MELTKIVCSCGETWLVENKKDISFPGNRELIAIAIIIMYNHLLEGHTIKTKKGEVNG